MSFLLSKTSRLIFFFVVLEGGMNNGGEKTGGIFEGGVVWRGYSLDFFSHVFVVGFDGFLHND